MTPAEALQCVLAAAKQEKIQLTKTTQERLLYLTDLRAFRHGSEWASGLVWERGDYGPHNRSVKLLARNVNVNLNKYVEYFEHASAVVSAYAQLDNEALGMVCKGSAPMRKAPRRGDELDFRAESTNDISAPVTYPQV